MTDEELKRMIELMRNDDEFWRRFYAAHALGGLSDGFFKETPWAASKKAFEYADQMLARHKPRGDR